MKNLLLQWLTHQKKQILRYAQIDSCSLDADFFSSRNNANPENPSQPY